MKFNIDHTIINLQIENNGLRLTTDCENWFIPNQTAEETKRVLEINHKIIKDHFVQKARPNITEIDLDNVCLKIALHYFQMYNH